MSSPTAADLVDHEKLDALKKQEDGAVTNILDCVSIWREYVRAKDRKFAAVWLKKLGEAEDARVVLSDAWSAEYERGRAESRAHAAALAAFEGDGGKLDTDAEAFAERWAEYDRMWVEALLFDLGVTIAAAQGREPGASGGVQ